MEKNFEAAKKAYEDYCAFIVVFNMAPTPSFFEQLESFGYESANEFYMDYYSDFAKNLPTINTDITEEETSEQIEAKLNDENSYLTFKKFNGLNAEVGENISEEQEQILIDADVHIIQNSLMSGIQIYCENDLVCYFIIKNTKFDGRFFSDKLIDFLKEKGYNVSEGNGFIVDGEQIGIASAFNLGTTLVGQFVIKLDDHSALLNSLYPAKEGEEQIKYGYLKNLTREELEIEIESWFGEV